MKQGDKDGRRLIDARKELEDLEKSLGLAEMDIFSAKQALEYSGEHLKSLIDHATAVGENDDAARIVFARAIIGYVKFLL
jgi:hypothetical protein